MFVLLGSRRTPAVICRNPDLSVMLVPERCAVSASIYNEGLLPSAVIARTCCEEDLSAAAVFADAIRLLRHSAGYYRAKPKA